MQNGAEFLTQHEAWLAYESGTIDALRSSSSGGMKFNMVDGVDWQKDEAKWASEHRSNTNSRVSTYARYALMSKLKGQSDKEGVQTGTRTDVYNTDGSETHYYYNMQGELTAIINKGANGSLNQTYNNEAYNYDEKVTNDFSATTPQATQAGFDGWEHTIGPALMGLGANILDARGKFAGATPGTSIASKTLSKALPYTSPVIKKVTTNILGKKAGTAVLGRALGRFVPFVGWALTAYDMASSTYEFGQYLNTPEGQEQMQNYSNSNLHPGIFCFVKGTIIYGKEGFKTIESINVGDSVYSYNFSIESVEKSQVTKIFERISEDIYILKTRSEQVMVTGEHPFYVINKGWTKVKDLNLHDELKTDNNVIIKLLEINHMTEKHEVYNIEVKGNHNYFISKNKILVHNK